MYDVIYVNTFGVERIAVSGLTYKQAEIVRDELNAIKSTKQYKMLKGVGL